MVVDLTALIRASIGPTPQHWGVAPIQRFRPHQAPGVMPLEVRVDTVQGQKTYYLFELGGADGWLLKNGRKLLVTDKEATWGYDFVYLARLMELADMIGDPGAYSPTLYAPEGPAPLLIYFNEYVGVIAEAYFTKRERRYPLQVVMHTSEEESPTWPYGLALLDKNGNELHVWPFTAEAISGVKE